MTIGGHFVLDDVNCTGNESSIFDCQHSSMSDCQVSNKEEAGVLCGVSRGTIHWILHRDVHIISVYANLLKDFSVRCTEEHTSKVSSIDGSNSTNLTIGRYCVHVL